jgi:hypothetical protein
MTPKHVPGLRSLSSLYMISRYRSLPSRVLNWCLSMRTKRTLHHSRIPRLSAVVSSIASTSLRPALRSLGAIDRRPQRRALTYSTSPPVSFLGFSHSRRGTLQDSTQTRRFHTNSTTRSPSTIAFEKMHLTESAVPPAPSLPQELSYGEGSHVNGIDGGHASHINGHAAVTLSERCEQVYEQVNDFLHRAPRDGEDGRRLEHARRQTRLSLDIIAEALEKYR